MAGDRRRVVTPEDTLGEVQAAMDDLAAAGGGELRFAPGVFEFDDTLVWRARVDLRGAGDATCLRVTETANVVEADHEEGAPDAGLHDATIADLRIDGNRQEVPDGTGPDESFPNTHATSGLWLPFAERVTVRNLRVERCHGHGVHVDAVTDCAVRDTVVRDCLVGVHVAPWDDYEYGPTRTLVVGNAVLDCRLTGINVGSRATQCLAALNRVANSGHGGGRTGTWSGLSLRGRLNAAVMNLVEGSGPGVLLHNSRDEAEEFQYSRGLAALGNRVVDTAGPGVQLFEVRDAQVAWNAVDGAESPGVRAEHAPGLTVADNQVRNAPGGVKLTDCGDATVAGNAVRDVSGPGVEVSETTGFLVAATTVSGAAGPPVATADADAGLVVANRADGDDLPAFDGDVVATANRWGDAADGRAPVRRETGTATESGDGDAREFVIDHDLSRTPDAVNVWPESADAAGAFYVSGRTAETVAVTYRDPPPAGEGNLAWGYELRAG